MWFLAHARSAVGARILQPEISQRTTANSRRKTLRAQPFSRTYSCWRCVCNIRVSNLDTLAMAVSTRTWSASREKTRRRVVTAVYLSTMQSTHSLSATGGERQGRLSVSDGRYVGKYRYVSVVSVSICRNNRIKVSI